MVGIDSVNTTLTFDKVGLTPGVAFEPLLNPKRAVFHLTKGYTLTKDTETIKHAWTAKGEGPGQSKSGTQGDEELGFLQTQEVDTIQFFYAGEKRSHGSMTIDVAPSVSPKTCLDSEDNLNPWASDDMSLDNGIWKANTGDHPAARRATRLGNVVTNKPNFLFHVIDRRRYVTILTLRLVQTVYSTSLVQMVSLPQRQNKMDWRQTQSGQQYVNQFIWGCESRSD